MCAQGSRCTHSLSIRGVPILVLVRMGRHSQAGTAAASGAASGYGMHAQGRHSAHSKGIWGVSLALALARLETRLQAGVATARCCCGNSPQQRLPTNQHAKPYPKMSTATATAISKITSSVGSTSRCDSVYLLRRWQLIRRLGLGPQPASMRLGSVRRIGMVGTPSVNRWQIVSISIC